METKQQIDHLIELAIIQRSELKRLTDQLPVLRGFMLEQINATIEDMEPQLRSDLIEFCDEKTNGKIEEIRAFFNEAKDEFKTKSNDFFVQLEQSVISRYGEFQKELQGRYESLLAQKEVAFDFAEDARKHLEIAAKQETDKIPAQVSAQVTELLDAAFARFPRAGELDQLRKEFAEPRGLNPRGKWKSTEVYQKLDLVAFNGDSYVSNVNDNTERPGRSSEVWTLSAARGQGGGGGGITSLNDIIGTPTSDLVVIGAEGNNFVQKTLTAGTNVTLTETPTTITIAASASGGVNYQGTWNASTNTPNLTSGVGTNGYYYVVSFAGSTNLDGITDWKVGDWAIYNGTSWQKVDNTDQVSSVFGRTGAVDAVSTDYSAVGITNTAIGASNPSTGAFTTLTTTGTIQPSGSVHAANGSAANPSLAFVNSQNTGLYRYGAGAIGISAGGTSVGNWDSTALTVSNNLTVSGGTITGGATGLSLASGGTNQNITLTPSGTGFVTTPGILKTTNTTASTSTTTGALVVSGGVGIGGNVYANGTVYAMNLNFGLSQSATVRFSNVISMDMGMESSDLWSVRDASSGVTALKWTHSTGSLSVPSTTSSTSTTTGALVVSGGAGFANNVTVGGYGRFVTNSGSLYITNSGFLGDWSVLTQDSNFAAANHVLSASLSGVYTKLNAPSGGTLGLSIGNSTRISLTYTDTTLTTNLAVNSTTASTSTTTGALVVSGGVGVAGALYTGGNHIIGTGNQVTIRNIGTGLGATPTANIDIQDTNDSSIRLWRSSAEFVQLAAARGGLTSNNNIFLFDVVGPSFNQARALSFRSSIDGGTSYKTSLQLLTFNNSNDTNVGVSKWISNAINDGSTVASGTNPRLVANQFEASPLTATNASVTTTNAATVYITGGPTASTNQTITNSWGLWNVGKTRLDGVTKITDTTASTSTTSGALQVAGGVGIGGALNVSSSGGIAIGTNPALASSIRFPNDFRIIDNGFSSFDINWISTLLVRISASTGSMLLGTGTDSSNGRLQLATHTTSAGGIGFGTDLALFRQTANRVTLSTTSGSSVEFRLFNGSGNAFTMSYGYPFAPELLADDALSIRSSGSSITLKSNNATALTLDTSQNATFAGKITANGAGSTFKGTTTNDSAATGYIGEYVSSSIGYGGRQALTTGTWLNITSISLTAGDWDVDGTVVYEGTSATITRFSGAPTTTSASPDADNDTFDNRQSIITLSGNVGAFATPKRRVSISSTTTVYLISRGYFSAGTLETYGRIQARRVR
jgi:hypothetical protein